jgi:hypothetical protein
MKVQIEKETLVEIIRTACWSCGHKECIDCIIRQAKIKYEINVPVI